MSLYSTFLVERWKKNQRPKQKKICSSRHLWSGHPQGLTFKDGSMLIPPVLCFYVFQGPLWRTDNIGFMTENDMLALFLHYSYHVPPNLECLLAIGTYWAQNLSAKKMRQRFKTWAFDSVVCSVFRGLSHFRRRKVLHHAFVASAAASMVWGQKLCHTNCWSPTL